MVKLQTENGKLLYINGKLIADEDCCCDDDCPECPPIEDFPPFCEMIIDTPLGELHLTYASSPDPADIPVWRILTYEDDGIPEGECWYGLDIPLHATECIGSCEDLEPDFPLPETGSKLTCRFSDPCCIDDPPPGEGEECQTFADGWRYDVLEGFIRFAKRELISSALGLLQYKINCETGQRYRKLKFSYMHDQQFRGRFIGTHTKSHVRQSNEAIICSTGDVIEHNLNPDHACDECPEFQWIGGESDHSTGHDWTYPQGNPLDYSLLINEAAVGLLYSTNFGVRYEEETWVEIDAFFEAEDFLPFAGCAPCYPHTDTGYLICSQTPDAVVGSGLCQHVTWSPTITQWTYWVCNGDYGVGGPHPLYRWTATAAFPAAGLYDIDLNMVGFDCGNPVWEPPGDYPDDGVEYITHGVTWNTSAPASCTPTQPEEAAPC